MTAPTSTLTRTLGLDALSDPDMLTPAQIVREAEGHRNEFGEWVPGETTTTDIQVVSEPLGEQDRLLLEEGIRFAEGRKFLTRAAASAVRAGVSDGDLFRYGNETYRVVRLQDWGGFRVALCVVPEAQNDN